MYGQKAGMGASNEATTCPCAARSTYCQARDEFIQSIKEIMVTCSRQEAWNRSQYQLVPSIRWINEHMDLQVASSTSNSRQDGPRFRGCLWHNCVIFFDFRCDLPVLRVSSSGACRRDEGQSVGSINVSCSGHLAATVAGIIVPLSTWASTVLATDCTATHSVPLPGIPNVCTEAEVHGQIVGHFNQNL
jgi:hypothetical protein